MEKQEQLLGDTTMECAALREQNASLRASLQQGRAMSSSVDVAPSAIFSHTWEGAGKLGLQIGSRRTLAGGSREVIITDIINDRLPSQLHEGMVLAEVMMTTSKTSC